MKQVLLIFGISDPANFEFKGKLDASLSSVPDQPTISIVMVTTRPFLTILILLLKKLTHWVYWTVLGVYEGAVAMLSRIQEGNLLRSVYEGTLLRSVYEGTL